MNELSAIPNLPTSADFADGVRRVRDTDLGKWLGYPDPSDCRELVKRLIRSEKLNDSEVFRAARETSKKGGRPSIEYWLTRAQSQKVIVYSETKKGDEMLDLLIAVFERATERAFQSQYLEARILQFEQRRAWERLWNDHVIAPICSVYKWPLRNANGGFYAPLASVMRWLYRLLLGDEVYAELKARNPSPKFGSNHHQLFQQKVFEMVGDDLKIVAVIARQSAGKRDFRLRLNRHFRKEMLQLPLGAS